MNCSCRADLPFRTVSEGGAMVVLIMSTSQENNIEYTVFAKEFFFSIAYSRKNERE
jgi:hypothetical protein